MDFPQLLPTYGPIGIRPERLAREQWIVEVVEKNQIAFMELRASIDKCEEIERQRT
jgi:hypothetical protein